MKGGKPLNEIRQMADEKFIKTYLHGLQRSMAEQEIGHQYHKCRALSLLSSVNAWKITNLLIFTYKDYRSH